MKKFTSFLLALVSILAVALVFGGCGDKDEAEIIRELKLKYLHAHLITDYPDATVDDVTIVKYYGQYGNSYVALISDGYHEYRGVISQETIKDLVFTYTNTNSVKVFDGVRFYNLKEAYLTSILTMEDLQLLHRQFPKPTEEGNELHGEPIK